MKRILSILGSICLIAFASIAMAHGIHFDDINVNHWAHDAINTMAKNGILSGYPDGSFKPDAPVSRAEFAKIMVKALDLDAANATTIEFDDIAEGTWAKPYIDAAQQYLTGYKRGDVLSFKPDMPAKREDMAVALVKALQYPLGDEAKLADYSDAAAISKNLRPYMAAAIEKGLIKGYRRDGKMYIDPQGNLTRAETSQLLYNMMQPTTSVESAEEKVILEPIDSKRQKSDEKSKSDKKSKDESSKDKTDRDEDDDIAVQPVGEITLSYEIADSLIHLNWTVSNTAQLKGYKIVASKDNPSPSYPQDGYYRYIRDLEQTDVAIDSYDYSDGDFEKFVEGDTYYFAVTALYENGKVTSPAVKVQFPSELKLPPIDDDPDDKKPSDDKKPPSQTPTGTLEVELSDAVDGVELRWNKLDTAQGFKYYKVVASLNDSEPQYPENGYAAFIGDIDQTDYTITIGDDYTRGDFDAFAEKQGYYFAITAVYENAKVTSPAVYRELPELPHILPIEPESETE